MKWRYQQLVERPLFPLAGDGHSCQHQRAHHGQRADQAWDHAPARIQVGIEPRAGHGPNCRAALTVVGTPTRVERFDHDLKIPQGGARSVGIAAIGYHLNLCGFASQQVPLEILSDLDDQERAAVVNPGVDVLGPAENGLAPKNARSIQAGEKGSGGGALVLVKDGVGDGIEVEAGGVAEDEALQDRRHKDDESAPRILQDGEKFLPNQCQDAKERGTHTIGSGKLLAGGQSR
jgi:hypothetical protein